MGEGSDIVRLAEELAAKAASLQARAEAGLDDERATELRAELDRLEKELAALEAEEEALESEFDFEDDSEPGTTGGAVGDDLGREIGELVDRVLDTVAARLGNLGSSLGTSLATNFTGGRATDTVERVVPVDGPTPVTVRSQAGGVTVRPAVGDEVRVIAERAAPTEDQLAEMRVVVEHSGLGVDIRTEWPRGWRRRIRLTVEVPATSPVTVTTNGGVISVDGTRGPATLRTKGGSIRATGTAGEVDVDTAGGSIRILDHHGSARARTSGGSVRIAGHIEGEVDARTSGGSIRVFDLDGATVRASTSGGSVKVTGRIVGQSSIETSGGSITLSVPADANLHVEGSGSSLHSEFGSIHTAAGRFEGSLGDGSDGSVRVRTSGGSVHLRKL